MPLAPLSDPALAAIVAGLGLGDQPDASAEALAESLLGKRVLIVVTTSSTCCPTAPRPRRAHLYLPHSPLVVTSRERLQVAAETVWPVPRTVEHGR